MHCFGGGRGGVGGWILGYFVVVWGAVFGGAVSLTRDCTNRGGGGVLINYLRYRGWAKLLKNTK